MSRTALFANAFNEIIDKARKEADQQKAGIEKELAKARAALEENQTKVTDLEQQLRDIDDELAVGLVAAARNAGIKVDLKRAAAAVQTPGATGDSGKSRSNETAREKAAVMALLNKQKGRWVPSTEIKDTTGVERPVSVLLKNTDEVESRGKGRGVQYRLKG